MINPKKFIIKLIFGSTFNIIFYLSLRIVISRLKLFKISFEFTIIKIFTSLFLEKHSNLREKISMSDSDSSFYEESSFVKIFEGVGSIGAIYVSSTYEARDIQLLKCTFNTII